MKNSKIAGFFKSIELTAKKHSPEILTGIGIAGMITTTILAVGATPKALRLIEDEEIRRSAETNEYVPVSNVDKVKLCWKCYIPAAVTGTASVACLVGASKVSLKRNAALATAYKLSETALTDYREKVIETIGEKKEKVVQEKVAEKKLEENPVNDKTVIITGRGDTLCFDPMSSRYFRSSIEKIKAAENKLNKDMIHSITGYCSLNDFYDELGISHTEVGDLVGWNTVRLIDIDINAKVADNGEPCIAICYFNRPDYNFEVC